MTLMMDYVMPEKFNSGDKTGDKIISFPASNFPKNNEAIFLLYETTVKGNNDTPYIGTHGIHVDTSQKDAIKKAIANDKYKGSGTLIKNLQKLLPEEFFNRTILGIFETSEEARKAEKHILNMKDINTLNIRGGGGGRHLSFKLIGAAITFSLFAINFFKSNNQTNNKLIN